jgi:hypothetical protein
VVGWLQENQPGSDTNSTRNRRPRTVSCGARAQKADGDDSTSQSSAYGQRLPPGSVVPLLRLPFGEHSPTRHNIGVTMDSKQPRDEYLAVNVTHRIRAMRKNDSTTADSYCMSRAMSLQRLRSYWGIAAMNGGHRRCTGDRQLRTSGWQPARRRDRR